MKYLIAPLFALSVISCSAPASIDGQIAGDDFSVSGAAASLDGDTLTILIRNAPLSCADAAAAEESGEPLETPSPIGLQSLSLSLVTNGPDGNLPLNVQTPFEIGVNAEGPNTASAVYSPDGCGNDGEAAIGGSVTIDTIEAELAGGTFDLVFVSGEASGTFSVDRCNLTPFTPDTALCQ